MIMLRQIAAIMSLNARQNKKTTYHLIARTTQQNLKITSPSIVFFSALTLDSCLARQIKHDD
jgi:hypothetical protein